jgi:hypothetical protein
MGGYIVDGVLIHFDDVVEVRTLEDDGPLPECGVKSS